MVVANPAESIDTRQHCEKAAVCRLAHSKRAPLRIIVIDEMEGGLVVFDKRANLFSDRKRRVHLPQYLASVDGSTLRMAAARYSPLVHSGARGLRDIVQERSCKQDESFTLW
ncbi:MAG TPA: hypothetical protein VFB43_08735 [Terracidiphilus sp.]|nr:hypothetical protein [Terracidiphilus sp.]